MGLFGPSNSNSKAKIKRRPTNRTPRAPRSLQEKREVQAEKLFMEKAKTNPALIDAYIAKYLGMDLPKPIDPIEATKNDLRREATGIAIEELKNDPDMRALAVQGALGDMFGKVPTQRRRSRDGEDEEYYGGEEGDGEGISKVLSDIEDLEEVRKKLGGGQSSSGLSSFVNAETITEFLKTIQAFGHPPAAVAAPAPRIYVVSWQGKTYELDEGQYRNFRAEQAKLEAAPVAKAAVTAPTTPAGVEGGAGVTISAPPEPPTGTAEPALDGTAPPASGDIVDQYLAQFAPQLAELDKALEASPDLYVQTIIEHCNAGETIYQALFKYLATHSYDQIMTVIKPFAASKPQLTGHVEKIEKNKIWFLNVLEALHALAKDAEEGTVS